MAPHARKEGKTGILDGFIDSNSTYRAYQFFESVVKIIRIRNGEHKTLETLINEETLLFAKYLRGEEKKWIPRVSFI